MGQDFKFADLGEGITEGELVKWLVNEGDTVEKDQPILEIETDKAVVEITSPFSGVVQALHFKPGDIVHVGDTLMSFAEEGEGTKEEKEPAEHALATPHTRRLARELGINIEDVSGTGPGGRVMDEDLRRLATDRGIAATPPPEAELSAEQFEKWGEIERVSLKRVRRKIARHMIQARRLTAPVTHIDEADVGELVKIRDEMRPKAAKRGAKLTFLPFLIRALETALKQFPSLNASIVGNEIIVKKYYNIGFAVDTEDGLLVPVVKNVESKSLLDLAVELQELSDKARQRKLELADLKGSTFSITNIGSIGGRYFTPIINYPDCAILGLGRVYEKPIAKEGHVVTRPVMSLNLTYDHRITDGATGARFVNHVIERLEDPQLLFMEID